MCNIWGYVGRERETKRDRYRPVEEDRDREREREIYIYVFVCIYIYVYMIYGLRSQYPNPGQAFPESGRWGRVQAELAPRLLVKLLQLFGGSGFRV